MNNKHRDLIFGYVIAVHYDCHAYKFSKESMGFRKSYEPDSFNIAPIELKLGLWFKGGVVNIPTKFEEILRKLKF